MSVEIVNNQPVISFGGGTEASTVTINRATRSVPAGSVNSSNVNFELSVEPILGTEEIFLNGMLLNITDDYAISGKNITMVVAPSAGDKLVVSFFY